MTNQILTDQKKVNEWLNLVSDLIGSAKLEFDYSDKQKDIVLAIRGLEFAFEELTGTKYRN